MSFPLRCLFISLAISTSLSAPAASASETPGVAIGSVLDISGRVTTISGKNHTPLDLLDRLEYGQTVFVPAGGKLVFLYRPERVEYTFTGPAMLYLSASGIQIKNGNSGIVRTLPGNLLTRLEPNSRTRPELRGASAGAYTPELGEVVLTDRPLLSWAAGVAKKPFTLNVTDCGIVLTDCNAAAKELTPRGPAWRPADHEALQWGHFYRWTVTLNDKRGTIVQGWFQVISESGLNFLEAFHPGESREFSQLVLYAQALESVGARGEARALWRQLAEARPDQRVLMCKVAGRPLEQCKHTENGR